MSHIAIITSPPKATPHTHFPDGAITGNGDVSLIWGGTPEKLRLYICKADFWRAEPGDRAVNGISPIGIIEIRNPMLTGSPYYVEQDHDKAEIKGQFSGAGCNVKIKTLCAATENTVLIEMEATWPGVTVSVEPVAIDGVQDVSEICKDGNIKTLLRGFDNPSLDFPTYAMCALRKISQTKADNKIRLRYVVAVTTNHDSAAYKRDAIIRAEAYDDELFEETAKRHRYWWKRFWSKSKIDLPHDRDIEDYWYASIYSLACSARNIKFPPGLWGNFATADNMAWAGDYHLNYNFCAPFYPLCSANHIELTDCYIAPFNDYMAQARLNAREHLGCGGAYYTVGIGPLSLDTSCYEPALEHGKLFLGQKSNGIYNAVIPAMRWYATRDKAYAFDVAYPYMKAVMRLWEDYLVFENGRYIVINDALHEVEYYSSGEFRPKRHDDMNPIISLGMLKMTLKCLLDMRRELDIDPEKEEKWEHILNDLSEPTLYEKDGKEFVRATERGQQDSGLVLQYMYPANAMGLHSDKRLVDAMTNVFKCTRGWINDNLFCSYYPIAARLGIDPAEILANMREAIAKRSLPNMLFNFAGGGLENSAGVPACINEMLLQGYEGVLRIFPNWDIWHDAEFERLRADGAFLVSARLKCGRVSAEILSETGSTLTLEAPYGKKFVLSGADTDIEFDSIITVQTSPMAKYTLKEI